MAKRGRKSLLSTHIDPLLMEGGRTVAEIADEVMERVKETPNRDGSAFTRNGVLNNIRQRMFVLPKYGFKMEKDKDKRIRFVKTTPESTRVSDSSISRQSDREITR